MCTEKLAKVYFWRHGQSPGLRHDVFAPFLRHLESTRAADFHLMFGFKDPRRFSIQKVAIINLAERIQNLAPAGRNTGPNPEYPWPPTMPAQGPLTYPFPEWRDWNKSAAGRHLKFFVENLLQNYLVYFP